MDRILAPECFTEYCGGGHFLPFVHIAGSGIGGLLRLLGGGGGHPRGNKRVLEKVQAAKTFQVPPNGLNNSNFGALGRVHDLGYMA